MSMLMANPQRDTHSQRYRTKSDIDVAADAIGDSYSHAYVTPDVDKDTGYTYVRMHAMI